jgi:hypothetical protein
MIFTKLLWVGKHVSRELHEQAFAGIEFLWA